jgi:hypothetical protein
MGVAMRVFMALALVSAGSTSVGRAVPTQAVGGQDRITFDAKQNVRSFYGVPMNLTISSLKRLPYRAKLGHAEDEGGEYTYARIRAKDGVEVTVDFDSRGRLERLETSSPNAVGPNGIRVGSTLSDLKAAWPKGGFIYGCEEGFYATYITGTNLVFDIDPKGMPPKVFTCSPTEDVELPVLLVKSIRIQSRTITLPGASRT